MYLIHVFEHRAYPLEQDTFSIGRDASNEIVIRESNVSRCHAQIRRQPRGFVLAPMGSGATRVNGASVTAEHELQDGDNIGVAYETFIFTAGPLPLGVSVIDQLPEHTVGPETLRPTIVHTALTDRELRPKTNPTLMLLGAVALIMIAAGVVYLVSR